LEVLHESEEAEGAWRILKWSLERLSFEGYGAVLRAGPIFYNFFWFGFGERGCPTQATFLQSVVDVRGRAGRMDMEERVSGV
jgi:hypothetical protein